MSEFDNPMPSLTIDAVVESWPIAGAFVIARGAKREATVVVAQVSDGTVTGRGECVPYARYGETVAGVRDAILAMRGALGRPRQPAAADAAGRRPQCARLRAVGLRGQALRHVGRTARRPRRRCNRRPPPTPSASTAPRRWPARRPQCRAHHAAPEAQARRRRRRRAPAPGPRRVSRPRASSPTPTRRGRRSCCPR